MSHSQHHLFPPHPPVLSSLSSLITRLSPVAPAVRGDVYLWPRLFKFICGCQMRESIKSLGLLSLPWASANHSARVYYVSLISAVRNVCAHVLYSRVCKWLRFSCVDPWRRPACMCMCVCVYVQWGKALLQVMGCYIRLYLVSDLAALLEPFCNNVLSVAV